MDKEKLYKEILIRILEESEMQVFCIDNIIKDRCYKTLSEIVEIIKTPNFDDKECFFRIEQIIIKLESLGCDCDFRHDF